MIDEPPWTASSPKTASDHVLKEGVENAQQRQRGRQAPAIGAGYENKHMQRFADELEAISNKYDYHPADDTAYGCNIKKHEGRLSSDSERDGSTKDDENALAVEHMEPMKTMRMHQCIETIRKQSRRCDGLLLHLRAARRRVTNVRFHVVSMHRSIRRHMVPEF